MRKKEVGTVFKSGQGKREGLLILKILKNQAAGRKFSIIVPSKVSKKAIVRNKVKRRLSELLRVKIKNIKVGTCGIILAVSGIEKKDFKELEKMLDNLLERAKILEDKKDVQKNIN